MHLRAVLCCVCLWPRPTCMYRAHACSPVAWVRCLLGTCTAVTEGECIRCITPLNVYCIRCRGRNLNTLIRTKLIKTGMLTTPRLGGWALCTALCECMLPRQSNTDHNTSEHRVSAHLPSTNNDGIRRYARCDCHAGKYHMTRPGLVVLQHAHLGLGAYASSLRRIRRNFMSVSAPRLEKLRRAS